MTYRILWEPAAERRLKQLPSKVQTRALHAVESLAENPHPPRSVKMAGHEHLYRIRVGDYRVVYAVMDDLLVVLVVELGHRRDVYRGLDPGVYEKRLGRFLIELIKT